MAVFKREDLNRVLFSDLSEQCDESLIHELCTQFGPVARVKWPSTTTNISGTSQRTNYCFVDFYCPEDAKYCFEALYRSHVKLFDKEVRVSHASTEIAQREAGGRSGGRGAVQGLHEIGAKIIIRNVDKTATEYEIATFFEQFGSLAVPPRMLRDYAGNFRGIVILSYRDFTSSDRAVREMHEKVYRDRVISVQYAEMEDGSGRLHGSAEERANARLIKAEERKYQEKIARETTEARQHQQHNRVNQTSWADNVDVYSQARRR